MDLIRTRGTHLLVATACYLAATAASSLVTNPAHPKILAVEPVLLALLAGVVGALVTGAVSKRLPLPAWPRIGLLFVVAYTLETLSNWVEAVLFVRDVSPLIPVSGALLAAGLAVPAGLLWQPEQDVRPVGLRSRTGWSWTWRVAVAAVLWAPVYFVFVAVDAPFVTKYYHETGTQFTIPSGGIILTAELIRGVLHAVVLGGLAPLLSRHRRRHVWLLLAVVLSAYNAWLPLIQHVEWPYYLRAANMLEITCDGVVYGGIIAWLLTARQSRTVTVDPGADVRT